MNLKAELRILQHQSQISYYKGQIEDYQIMIKIHEDKIKELMKGEVKK